VRRNHRRRGADQDTSLGDVLGKGDRRFLYTYTDKDIYIYTYIYQ
jgi:hypothetical protein